MKKYLAYYETEWPANIAELTAIENKPFVGYLKENKEVKYTDIITGPADNEIWYTSSDGNIVVPYMTYRFGANIVSNTYEDGKGVIKFDSTVTSIGEYTFYHCSSLTSIVIPDSVTNIGLDAFSGCESLATIVIPDSVTSIGSGAFCCCRPLTSINIPYGVEHLGDHTFSETSLVSVVLPISVISLEGLEIFTGKIEDIYYEGTLEQWNNIAVLGKDYGYKHGTWYGYLNNTKGNTLTVHCSDGNIVLPNQSPA